MNGPSYLDSIMLPTVDAYQSLLYTDTAIETYGGAARLVDEQHVSYAGSNMNVTFRVSVSGSYQFRSSLFNGQAGIAQLFDDDGAQTLALNLARNFPGRFSEQTDNLFLGAGARYLIFAGGDTLERASATWAVSLIPLFPVPEPTTVLLLTSGLLGLAVARRKQL